MKPGLLLVNLGTPDSAAVPDVRRYLREFLADGRVLDLHPVGRWLLLNLVILPFRPRHSAEAYRRIWTPQGSPLLLHGRALAAAVQQALPQTPVRLAMRYGRPSLADGVRELRQAGANHLLVLPLYPQAAASTTGSTLAEVYRLLGSGWDVPGVQVVPPFHGHPAFLDAFAAVGRAALGDHGADHVVFSFHGVPERHVTRSDASGAHCLRTADCCAAPGPVNRDCYRAQCFATARALAGALALGEGTWTVSFQSRLGRTPWIGPYTDHVLRELAAQRVRRVAVMCPAFVADCLETLEEIGVRARDDYRARFPDGELHLVPSLNAEPAWVAAVVRLVREACPAVQ
ncbi:MAG: ferrochelatase [Deltaproteobacteria bacterium]|nr:ferrochelatase [Deltaproteobacteria bacterium]